MSTTVLVVDDQALLRTAFSSLIAAEDDLDVAGQAADGRQAVELARSLAPDVVVPLDQSAGSTSTRLMKISSARRPGLSVSRSTIRR